MNISSFPPKLKKIVEYLNNANDLSNPLEATVGAVYSQVSRLLCYNRVKFQGMKGDEFPMLYFISFAPSGAYKDEVIRQISLVCENALKQQKAVKAKIIDFQKDRYILKESSQKFDKTDRNSKAEYRKENYPIDWRNTFVGGTPQGLHKDRLGMMESGYGELHFEHSEIMDFLSKRDTNITEILSYYKDCYNSGNTRTDTIASERRKNVEGVPMTMFLHGVSTGLKEDKNLYNNLMYILESGIIKRCFFIYNNTQQRVKLTYEEKQKLNEYVQKNKEEVSDIFSELYSAIRIRLKFDDDFTHHVLQDCNVTIEESVLREINDYRNSCIELATEQNNKVMATDIFDRFWRATRLAVCVAMLEHPKNPTVTGEDFRFAKEYVDHVGATFSLFLKDKNEKNVDAVFEFLKNSKCDQPKGVIKDMAKVKYKQEVDAFFMDLAEKCELEGYVLGMNTAGKNLKMYYVSKNIN